VQILAVDGELTLDVGEYRDARCEELESFVRNRPITTRERFVDADWIRKLDVLRTHALPDTDVRDPAAVLTALNAVFQMSDHGNRYLTIWYGVYDRRDRSLAFATGGHPPALMLLGRHRLEKLGCPGLFIGGFPDARFEVQKVSDQRPVQPGAVQRRPVRECRRRRLGPGTR
jgi:hypothetical protein